MFKFLDDEHLCGAAKCRKKVLCGIKSGEITNPDVTPEKAIEAIDAVQPLMVYACRRGVKIGAAAVVAGVLFAMSVDAFAPRIREAVMKKFGK